MVTNSKVTLKRIFISFLATVFLIIAMSTIFMNTLLPHSSRFLEDETWYEMGQSHVVASSPYPYELVEHLRRRLIPPVNDPLKQHLEEYDPSQGQGRAVRRLTNYKTNGFFVECGCGNGRMSNTLFLEQQLGWKGLLVEADPDNIKYILKTNRNAWVAPFCMSLNTSVYVTELGDVLPESTFPYSTFKIQCYPFFTFLLALKVTTVDYFSLDVDGNEILVLDTVPFDKVDIRVLSVDFSKSQGGLLGVKKTMEDKGYKIAVEVPPHDLIFVKKDHKM